MSHQEAAIEILQYFDV